MSFFTITHEIPLELHYRLSDNWSLTGMARFGLQHYFSRPDIGVISRSKFYMQPAIGLKYNISR